MAQAAERSVLGLPRPQSDDTVWGWLVTVDHKKIGIMYFVLSFVNLLIGGLEALLMRLQLAAPRITVFHPEVYNELFTMHGTTMIFMALMPMAAALFNYLIPLMIGARDVAFPRLNAFGFWTLFFGSLVLHSSFFLGGAPNVGWFAYAPLTERAFSSGPHVDFWVSGIQLLGIGSMTSGINFIVTILNMRTKSMALLQMPVFVWTTLVVSALLVFALPSITVASIMLLFDRYFGANFFAAQVGADVHLWQHLFWIFGHPEVYILILPAMGVISEVLPVAARKPLFGYTFVVLSSALIALLGFGVWAHHMFTSGLGPTVTSIFALGSMTIAIPTGIKIFNWLATLWGGSIRFFTAALYSISFLVVFTIGGMSGVMHAAAPSNLQHHDTYFVVAHFHYVLVGGTLVGMLAAIHYWFPKATGRLMNECLGKWNFWLFFITFNVTFFPMHFLGIAGMPRRIYTYDAELGLGFWNFVSTIGAWGMGVAFILLTYNMIRSYRRGEKAGDDPWDGRTLEWSISSPPPTYNFAALPEVESRDALWAKKRREPEAPDGPITSAPTPTTPASIHLPSPSYFPLLVGLGLGIAAYAAVFKNLGWTLGGFALAIAAIYGWAFEGVGGVYVEAKESAGGTP